MIGYGCSPEGLDFTCQGLGLGYAKSAMNALTLTHPPDGWM